MTDRHTQTPAHAPLAAVAAAPRAAAARSAAALVAVADSVRCLGGVWVDVACACESAAVASSAWGRDSAAFRAAAVAARAAFRAALAGDAAGADIAACAAAEYAESGVVS